MKAARARLLAARYPQSAEVLQLVAAAYDFIGRDQPVFADLQTLAERMQDALRDQAPEPLQNAIPGVAAYYHQPDPFAPASFFARLALETWARHAPLQMTNPSPNECPRCGHAPQLGVLRQSGNGDALFLGCSLCRHEWAYRRGTCPECGETDPEQITYYSTEGMPQVRTQVCGSCRAYIHLLLPEKDFAMIPEVDELALLAIDVWAVGQGWHKVWPNLAGL